MGPALGIKPLEGASVRIFGRNTGIPSTTKHVISTTEDNQTTISVDLFQGEKEVVIENRLLGQFDILDVLPAPRGIAQIEVTFDIDANKALYLSAKSLNKEHQIRIRVLGGLSEADIEKMVKDAEANAAEDNKRRSAVDTKSHADALVHSTAEALAEHGSMIAESERRAIEDAVHDLKEVLKGDDAEAIKVTTNTLAQVSMKLGEATYKQKAERDAAKYEGSSGPGTSRNAR